MKSIENKTMYVLKINEMKKLLVNLLFTVRIKSEIKISLRKSEANMKTNKRRTLIKEGMFEICKTNVGRRAFKSVGERNIKDM